jgi:hypothetical protein
MTATARTAWIRLAAGALITFFISACAGSGAGVGELN